MIDEQFITQKVQKGKQAREKAENQFSSLSGLQLNWKPSTGSWSIAECLEHLIISDSSYFDRLKTIISGTYKMTWWQKHSPFSSICAKLLKDRMQENATFKTVTHKKLKPSISDKPIDFVKTYLLNLDTFLDLVAQCKTADIDQIIITSPTIKIVTYNLRDAFEFLVNHEHRHINQAIQVKGNPEFPKD